MTSIARLDMEEVWSASINEAGSVEAGRLFGTNETPQPPPRSSSIDIMTHHHGLQR
jgi:hypothetical protein